MKKFCYFSLLGLLMAVTAAAQGPVVYLPLTDNLNDASGNSYNAVDSGTVATTFVTDAIRGKVAYFAKEASAALPHVDSLRFGPYQDFAFSLWLKMDTTGADPSILSNKDWDNGRNKGFVLFSDKSSTLGSNNWTINFCDGRTTEGGSGNRLYWQANLQGGDNAIDGTWHFIAASFDRTDTLRVFLDGVEQPSNIPLMHDSAYAYDNVNDYPIILMQDGTNQYGEDAPAYMSDLRVWRRTITAAEVKALYDDTKPKSGPVVHLPLADDLSDASGNNYNAVDSGTVATEFVTDAKRGKVAYFAKEASAALPHVDALRFGPYQDFAFSLWLKMDTTGADPSILSNKDWDNGRNKGFVLFSDKSSTLGSNNWTINFCDGRTTEGGSGNRLYWQANLQGGDNAIDGTWHFIAASFDRTDTLRVFLDGVEQPSNIPLMHDSAYAYDNVNDYPIILMQDGTNQYGEDAPAYMSDLRIWDRTISATEVKTLYDETNIDLGVPTVKPSSLNTSVYPNPTNGLAHLTFNMKSSSNARILIYNNIGILVKDIRYTGTVGQNEATFDVSGWLSGIYFVKVVSESNSEVVRLVVAK